MGLYVPLDVNFPDDEKIMAVGLDGAGLYAMALCIAKRLNRDGALTRNHLRRIGADDTLIDTLIDVDLIRCDPTETSERTPPDPGMSAWTRNGALRITAWLDHNPSAEAIEEARAKDAHRKRLTRTKRPNGQTQTSERTPTTRPPDSLLSEEKGKGREEKGKQHSSRAATSTEPHRPVDNPDPPRGDLHRIRNYTPDTTTPDPELNRTGLAAARNATRHQDQEADT